MTNKTEYFCTLHQRRIDRRTLKLRKCLEKNCKGISPILVHKCFEDYSPKYRLMSKETREAISAIK